MGGNLGRHDAFLNIVQVRQSQMFGRRNIAQKRRSAGGGKGSAYGCGNMVITRSNICHQRTKDIKRGSLADSLLYLHIGLNLVQRHMSRSFYDDLHILFPRPSGQLPQRHQLLNLGYIRCILNTSRTAGVSQAQCHIIGLTDIQYLLKMLIKRIFLSRHFHPCKYNRTSPGHNIGKALRLLEALRCLPVDSHMDGHEVHPILRMHPYDIQPLL